MSRKSRVPLKAVTKVTNEGVESSDLPPCLASTSDPERRAVLHCHFESDSKSDAGNWDRVSATIHIIDNGNVAPGMVLIR